MERISTYELHRRARALRDQAVGAALMRVIRSLLRRALTDKRRGADDRTKGAPAACGLS